MSTIYFDTNFYVWLASAHEDKAQAAIDQLNSLGVRHVCSDMILRELLASSNREDAHRILVRRCSNFKTSPFTIGGASWNALLSNGRAREVISQTIRNLNDQFAVAASHALHADISASSKKHDEWLSANQDNFLASGFLDSNGTIDLSKMLKITLDQLKSIGALESGIEIPRQLDPESCKKLHATLMNAIPKEARRRLELSRSLERSTVGSDDRYFKTSLGDERAQRSFASSIRDAGHMERFAYFSAQIDFLQVDRRQLQLIMRNSPRHHLVELGLASRCFTVPDLDSAIEKVRQLVEPHDSAHPPINSSH